jgi:hypothetical protein
MTEKIQLIRIAYEEGADIKADGKARGSLLIAE